MSASESDELLERALTAIEDLEQRLAAAERSSGPIAIVGVGCRFPGGANTPDDFWNQLVEGRDAVTEIPADRWDGDALFDPDPDAAGRAYTRWGGFLDQVDQFDADFFGTSPREAAAMDPAQRLLLEVSWEAMEHAGVRSASLAGTRTGVFVGMTGTDYADLQLRRGVIEEIDAYFGTGISQSIAAGRIAYTFDFRGPAIAVDTACSSSLVAVHQACMSLRAGETDAALAGGVNLMLSPDGHISTSRARMMSFEGRCKTFDAAADGYVRAEGSAMFLLRRLSDAVESGDRILAVIRGTATNQDGRSNGLTAPSGASQEAVIRAALRDASLEPREIDVVECHGTGTTLGDPIEVAALDAVYRKGRDSDHPLRVQSVKTNVGHLEAAAGVASLVKLVMALGDGQLPRHLHLTSPNPYIPWDRFRTVAEPGPWSWDDHGRPRRGGISSFGFSGTNVHMVVEQAPAIDPPSNIDRRPYAVVKAAGRSALAAAANATAIAAALSIDDEAAQRRLANVGRDDHDYRFAVAAAPGDGSRALRAAVELEPDAPSRHDGETVLLLTGQGAQRPGMGLQLAASEPDFAGPFNEALTSFSKHSGLDLSAVIAAADDRLHDTRFTQPALVAFEIALARLWESWGIVPTMLIGHSIGEYAAAHLAGVLSLDDTMRLVEARGRLMSKLSVGGSMMAVAASADAVATMLTDHGVTASIASINGPTNVVVSGAASELDRLQQALTDGPRVTRLAVSHAFHSPLMNPMLDAFAEVVNDVTFAPPTLDVIVNRTGTVATAATLADASYWLGHVIDPVQFADSIATAVGQGADLFLEVGPASTLTAMGRMIAPQGTTWIASSQSNKDERQALHEAVALAYQAGATVDWDRYEHHHPAPHGSLPTYAFQRSRHWARLAYPSNGAPDLAEAELGTSLGAEVAGGGQRETLLTATNPSWLADHRIYDQTVVPATAYLEMLRATAGDTAIEVADVRIDDACVVGDEGVILRTAVAPDGLITIEGRDGGKWRGHASGRVGEILSATTHEAPFVTSVEILGRGATVIEGEAYYSVLGELGVDFGPTFRCIQTAWRRDGEVVGLLEPRLDTDGAPIHPAMLDAGLQLLGLAVPGTGELDADTGEVYVPVSIGRFVIDGAVSGPVHASGVLAGDAGAEILTGSVALFTEDGTPVARLLDVAFKRARRGSLAVRSRTVGTLYAEEWVDAPAGDNEADGTPTFVLVDHADAAASIAPGLLSLAVSVVASDTELGTVVAAAPPQSLVFVADSEPNGDIDSIAAAVDALRRVTVAAHEAPIPPDVLVVVCGDANDVQQAAMVGALRGLARVAAAETRARVRILDVVAGEFEDAVRNELLILANPHDDEVEIRRRGADRQAFRLVRADRQAPRAFATSGAWLITGGLGGLGLTIARGLADAGAERLVLVGRSPSDEISQSAVARLEDTGVEVEILAADVTSASDVDRSVALATHGGHRLVGVVHAAGVVADALLADLDADVIRRVLAPKIVGAQLLLERCRDEHPDHIVFFGAGAAIFGAPGQGNYAAANAALSEISRVASSRGEPVVTIDWGPWRDVGMAAALGDDALRRWESQGLGAFDQKSGWAAFERVLNAGSSNLAALEIRWPTLLHYYGKHGIPSVMTDLAMSEQQVERTARKSMAEILLAVEVGERRGRLESIVAATFAQVLGLEPTLRLDTARGLTDMGMDSLMAVELGTLFSQDLGASLPSTFAFEHPTLGEIADELQNLLQADVSFVTKTVEPVAVGDQSDPAPDSNMTASELEAALLRELDDSGY